ncbi:hypothetical protein [Paenarthrobacter sp. YJN-D]|uniref:hypothetical protein n=1 Tax=Paenarthrobacter sp. YJN-D TaxID=2735317 RepID=UPI001878AE3A|nr:hypothetical protein [Paenarthrobacter sp. YJN-D]QOT21784.1 hypothetical protein HMI60_09705 [Paenarthrobacter sp. YJN-D]
MTGILLAGHGPDYGTRALTRALPSPAARLALNPLLSGTDGGHSIHLSELGRRDMHLDGHLEALDDGDTILSDDVRERTANVEQRFKQLRQVIDMWFDAEGIVAPERSPAHWPLQNPLCGMISPRAIVEFCVRRGDR